MRIIVIGGSAAGLSVALLLARDGHQVEVLDRDALAPAADPEAAASSAFRPAAPQLVQLHAVIPRGRLLLRDRLPDVYSALLDAGAMTSPVTDRMPATVTDWFPRAEDDDLAHLQVRRSTFDWVLRTIAAGEDGVLLRGETRVTGLLTRGSDPPHVAGVRTSHGDRQADIVIDASGRRSPVDAWLEHKGVRQSSRVETDCGLSYYTRHYRPRPGASWPQPGRLSLLQFMPHFGLVACTADDGVLSVAVCPATEDRMLRSLHRNRVYEAVLDTVPMLREWRVTARPIGDVQPMAGLRGLLRRLVVDGAPVALGLHAIGDAACHLNPTLGRGLSMALQGAARMSDAIRQHPDAPYDQALAMEAAVTNDLAPWFDEQTQLDTAFLGLLRCTERGEQPPPAPDPADGVLPAHVRAAAQHDAELFRSLMSVGGMLRRPDEVYDDPHVQARTRTVLAARATAPPEMPSRPALLEAIRAA